MESGYAELLMEIAKVLQRKYGHMSEIGRLTEEMAQCLQRSDKVSTQMLIEMRGEELDKVRECDRSLYVFLESVPPELRTWLGKALGGKCPVSENEYGKEGAVILKVAGNIRVVWEKLMAVDRHMNQRLAGKDSFYAGSR